MTTFSPTLRIPGLRNVLRANALFSALSGVLLIVDAAPIDRFLALGAPQVLQGVGVLLLVYAMWLFYQTAQEGVKPQVAQVAIVGDVAWVIGSWLIILSGVPELSTGGRWAVGIVADIVGVFAVLQVIGWRRMRGGEVYPS
jgi:hypothetical protein